MKFYSIRPRIMMSWLDSRSPPPPHSLFPPGLLFHLTLTPKEKTEAPSCSHCHSKRSTFPLFPGFQQLRAWREGEGRARIAQGSRASRPFLLGASTQKGHSDKPRSLNCLLVFIENVCILIHQGCWPIVFFSCSVLFWFCYLSNANLIK